MMNLPCLKIFNQGWLSWRVIVLAVGGTRWGSDLCIFQRPFPSLNMMSLMQIAFFFGKTQTSQVFWRFQLLPTVLNVSLQVLLT